MTPAEERCSIWQWLSIAPGNTSLPAASISRAPAARPRPRVAIDAVLDADVALRRVGRGRHRAVADHEIVVGHRCPPMPGVPRRCGKPVITCPEPAAAAKVAPSAAKVQGLLAASRDAGRLRLACRPRDDSLMTVMAGRGGMALIAATLGQDCGARAAHDGRRLRRACAARRLYRPALCAAAAVAGGVRPRLCRSRPAARAVRRLDGRVPGAGRRRSPSGSAAPWCSGSAPRWSGSAISPPGPAPAIRC